MFKRFIQQQLEKKVKKYLEIHKPILVVVVGSLGKTSTKMSIATVLAERFRVRTHEGNHNAHISAPLAILGIEYPGQIRSLSAWWKVFRAAQLRIKSPKDVDIIVQELGTDTPGDIAQFGTYLQADIAVVTAVTNEHMEFFKTIEAVAQEELSVAKFSKHVAINRDDVPEEYANMLTTTSFSTYGLGGTAEYHFLIEDSNFETGFTGKLMTQELGDIPISLQLVGEHNTKAAVAAGLVAAKLGMVADEIKSGMSKLRPVKGRMNVLRGQNATTIIDDSYNSSSYSATAALQTLYKIQAPQRIAILGSINEMGELSRAEHEKVGQACDPNALAWVVTIGEQARQYLAPIATSRGCQVRSFMSPYDAGAFVHSVMEKNAVILAKGSQNGVFTEEAIKILLHSTDDEAQLVRQSPHWLAIKQEQFSKF